MPEAGNQRQPLAVFIGWLILAVLIVVADAVTKHWASSSFVQGQFEAVFPWLNWTLAHNYGAAFSFLNDQPGWQRWFFSILAAGVSLVIIVWLFRLPAGQRVTAAGLAMILGGAVGNLIDRLRLGYVVDFIDVHYAGYHWPAFNIADSAITVGVILLLIDGFFLQSGSAKD